MEKSYQMAAKYLPQNKIREMLLLTMHQTKQHPHQKKSIL
jgi:hypothetical protein